jgi:hypothetical protein
MQLPLLFSTPLLLFSMQLLQLFSMQLPLLFSTPLLLFSMQLLRLFSTQLPLLFSTPLLLFSMQLLLLFSTQLRLQLPFSTLITIPLCTEPVRLCLRHGQQVSSSNNI